MSWNQSMPYDDWEVEYIISDSHKSRLCGIKAKHLKPYKEETNMKEIKSIDLNKLEQQLDEALAKETPESLNKWMNEEMKKGSKLINIEPKLVGNECVHFPIPPNMKLEVKDGMCYLYRDCGEYKENKCLQELKEYLSHATREELDKTMEEIEIALAPFKVGDKVIVKGYEGMGEDEIICVFKTYDGNIKYKTKNHLNAHYFMEDNLMKVGESNKEETMEEKEKLFQAIKDNGYKLNAETKTLEKLIESHTPKKFYIRIGDIPSEEKSAVYKGDVVIGYEDGVSVYDCVETDGLYRIVMPFPLKKGQGMTYECLIQEITQCRYKIENPRNVYLVSGMEVGKGNDNEPLIKEVKILKDLTSQFNTKTDNTEKTKTLEKLIKPKFKVGDKIEKCGYRYTIKEVREYHYLTKCGNLIAIANQDNWELAPNKFDITNLRPFDNCKYSLDNGRTWKFAQYWYIMDNYKIDDIKIELWQD